jgi:hypothetical protein
VAYYTLQVSENPSFANITHEANTTNTTTQTPALYDNKHYLRVRAQDRAQNTGEWSNTTNTTIKTITINEILPNPSNTSPWIELYNTKNKTHPLAGWLLLSTNSNTTLNQTINATRYLIIYTNQTTLALNTTDDTLQLQNEDAITIDTTNYTSLPAGYSYGRSRDGVGGFQTYNENQTTPGTANTQQHAIPLETGWNLISLPISL